MPQEIQRRSYGIERDSAEQAWFRETGIKPIGEPPLAHATDLPHWTAYVGWLLGAEKELTEREDFRAFCAKHASDGKVSFEAARIWLLRS